MFLRMWQYEVVQGREPDFERAYGADGDWARLFAASGGYIGTELFRCVGEPGKYLTVDRFTSSNAWRQFLTEHGPAYAELDHKLEALTLHEEELAPTPHD